MDAKLTGELIARKRKELGLSQAELAEQIHVTDKAISRWETGRGAPAVENLEPLAQALGLTVSELLSGRELTQEELPKAAEEQIMTSLKKNSQMMWTGVLRTILALAVLVVLYVALYLGYHFFTSVRVNELSDLEQAAEEQWPGFYAIETQKRGDYVAVLMRHENGSMRMCVYERDDIFENRWYGGGGGKPNVKPGELASWNYGSPQNEAVIIICGSDLPEETAYYTFRNNGTVYIRPVDETVLDLFIIPDGRSDINGIPILLDENLQAVDERWQSWVDDMLIFD